MVLAMPHRPQTWACKTLAQASPRQCTLSAPAWHQVLTQRHLHNIVPDFKALRQPAGFELESRVQVKAERHHRPPAGGLTGETSSHHRPGPR